MISVVIPLYNKQEHIAKTLASVLAQSFQDFEIIVVDDGSTDAGLVIAESVSDSRIKIISQQNKGVSAARNIGVHEAKGEFVAFLDADDLWMPDYLANQMLLVKKFPECDVFATNYIFRDEKGRETSTIINNLPFTESSGILTNYFKIAATSHPPVWTSAVMVRTGIFADFKGFPIGIKSGEDLLTWATLACSHNIAYHREPLAIFNVVGYDYKEKPKRIPPDFDIVGHELILLKRKFNPPYINLYISHWHKMRSSIFMRLRQRRKSIKEAMIGLRYDPLNFKLAAFIIINLLPSRLQPF